MENIGISIVIVNYNVKDFLLQCLRSIENSVVNVGVETIVVDNNSGDGSVEFLRPLFPNVQFFDLKENLGFGRANNYGFKHAKGKYILILNPDTILEPNTLQIMLDYMNAHPDVGISGCKALNPDGTFQLACRRGFPSPWASFCKLFGLQSFFPKSKLFAQYNQTFRSIDETYFIDAVIGAFMFAAKEVIEKTQGFDEDFFMYGEDLDLCYRTQKLGYKIAYVHTAQMIHFKGESAKRSSMNEIKRFYEAMEIFVKKHYSGSAFFLFFLRFGIFIRSIFASLNKKKRNLFVAISDLIIINSAMLFGTNLKFERYLGFPDYAYPLVFIVLSLVLVLSMFSVGEYFESKPSSKRAFYGYMISFFFLSSLTYFFNQYAFSRGVILVTIGAGTILSCSLRGVIYILDQARSKKKRKRIALIGKKFSENKIYDYHLNSNDIEFIGHIAANEQALKEIDFTALGETRNLDKIISQNKIDEIIIEEGSLNKNDLMNLIAKFSNKPIKFYLAQEYEDILTSKIINEISGDTNLPKLNLAKFRYRAVKRFVDILIALIGIILSPLLIFSKSPINAFKTILELIEGKISLIGLYQTKDEKFEIWKKGIIGLAHINSADKIGERVIQKLNSYYVQNYSISLDWDIIVKSLLKKFWK